MILAVILAITIFLWAVPVSFFGIEELTVVQQRMIAIFIFAALMWIFEVIPNWTTSLLVVVIMLLTVSDKGISLFCDPKYGTLIDYKTIMASFADPVVMLFLGGFVLAIVASKYGMDAAIAKVLLGMFGKNSKFVLLGFLIVISLFSMFMSNTATAAMMLAFLAPVLKALPDSETGKVALALSIPIAANLGGMGTPIGTPPNAIAIGALQNAGYNIEFGSWMARMIPFVIVMVLIAWLLLLAFFPFKSKTIEIKIEPKRDRKRDWRTYVAWITFFVTILLWVTEAATGINSNIVALIPLAVYTCTGVFKKEDISGQKEQQRRADERRRQESREDRKKKNRISFLEGEIERLEQKMKEIESVLSAPKEGDDVLELTREYLELKREADAKTEEWGELVD